MHYTKIDEFMSYNQKSIFSTEHVFFLQKPFIRVFPNQWRTNLQNRVLEEEIQQVSEILSKKLSVSSFISMQIRSGINRRNKYFGHG